MQERSRQPVFEDFLELSQSLNTKTTLMSKTLFYYVPLAVTSSCQCSKACRRTVQRSTAKSGPVLTPSIP